MAEKVKVSREVAEALNDRLAYDKPADIVATSAKNGWEERGSNNVGCLNKQYLDLDTLIRAVYFGYEVDETPTEKVAEYYKNHQELLKKWPKYPEQYARYRGILDAIEFVAKAYGLKIEGVNV